MIAAAAIVVGMAAIAVLAVIGVRALKPAAKGGSEAAGEQQHLDMGENSQTTVPEKPTTEGGTIPAGESVLPEDAEVTEQRPTVSPEPYEENGAYYMDIEGVKVLIVNKKYHLSSSFGAENAEAKAAFDRMAQGATAEGLSIYIQSGFRSYETQDAIFSRYAASEGEEAANKYSARPGQSEHQTGLAFDILGTSADTGLSSRFANTPEYAWLVKHCAEYGFILRFLDGKSDITGYIYEPWHYRYIGDAALAAKIMASGLCLEEYAGIA